ncbi:MAG: SMP-30/gluconolactonase/LRE family protein [Natronomonas sp.]|nr:SMP-30/gluconolactonase/LRE family protein [Natronomonas sp.]MDR9431948.1 SMP-30/gluconolactonase/LRE family protein [Natronomonas sp.]
MEVLAGDLAFPEGPAFDSDDTLWCTEAYAGALVRWEAETDGFDRVGVGGIPNAIAVDEDDALWICDFETDAIRRYDPRSETVETVVDSVDGEALDKPNDLAFDAEGNLVFTCSGHPEDAPNEPTQYVCCYLPDGTIEKIAEGLVFPNGLTFTPDGGIVVAETYKHRLLRASGIPTPASGRTSPPGPRSGVLSVPTA